MAKRIVVVVGEPSGDRLGAQLVSKLRELHPKLEVEGVIGAEMINAGCLQLHSMDTLAVMGLVDPILNLRSILRLRKWIINYILQDPPDLFIGIDAPDFNLYLEKTLHKAGIQTVHYVSPSVWAWREGRIKTIKEGVDLMLTLFPFEASFYKKHEVPVCYTGHPTADYIAMEPNRKLAKEELGFTFTDRVLAVLPGSRNSEMKKMVPVYLQVLKLLLADKPNIKIVMPLVQPAYESFVEYWKNKIFPELEIKYVIKDSYAVMRAADFALVTSGTATLEVMLHKVPMIVAYKTDWLTYQIVKRLVNVKYISLPNLLADAAIVPEFIQQDANAKQIAESLNELINSTSQQQTQIDKFIDLHKILRQDAAQKAAIAVDDLLYPKGMQDANSWS